MTARRDRLNGAGAQLATEVSINFGSSLALASSRRPIDFVCASAAAVGVFLLTWSTGELNLPGMLFALTAAAAWAAYILLTRRVAVTFPGLEGISVASVVSLALLVPFALVTVDYSRLDWAVLGLLLAVGVLSSAFPYTLDTYILRRITPRLYAIITSVGPVIAALFGALVLGETFLLQQQVAILVVCVAAGVAIATQRERPKSDLEITAGGIS
ncbi:EamA family transporter [Cryobacterium fucosi]|uniref:EamA family transporter n=1 Tax=Cryobacterium fucosi TaxID=1259157 RepID=A0A4R9B7U7_9MICO|nr:EamA family transporter [Cryobacterium fucosi]TFD77695.1 EamA family transporter [Cryobacterium fucosi]